MAIKFVNNVDFVFYNTKGLAIENLATAPSTTVEGAMYYNTSDNKLYYRNDSSWVPLTEDTVGVSTFTNTMGTFITGTNNAAATGAVSMGTIDLSATGTKNNTTFLRGDNTWAVPAYYSSWSIRGDDATAVETIVDGETVEFLGGTGIGTILNTSGSNAQLTISNAGVTGIIAGTNITIDQATGQVTINSADQYVGTVTSVGSGAGLTGGPITASGTLAVDYIGSDNIIKAAGDGTSDTLGNSDQILVSSTDAKYVNLSQVKTYIAGVTEVTSATTNQLTVANSTTTPALSIVTAAVVNGGAGLATGDQIYDFVIGQGYQPGTVTSITVAAGTGLTSTGSPIAVSGTITLALDVAGADNYILAQTAATAASTDTISFSDSTDSDTVKKSTLANIPMVALTAVKTYIDDAVANEGSFQGGYNAATNSPDLDTSPIVHSYSELNNILSLDITNRKIPSVLVVNGKNGVAGTFAHDSAISAFDRNYLTVSNDSLESPAECKDFAQKLFKANEVVQYEYGILTLEGAYLMENDVIRVETDDPKFSGNFRVIGKKVSFSPSSYSVGLNINRKPPTLAEYISSRDN